MAKNKVTAENEPLISQDCIMSAKNKYCIKLLYSNSKSAFCLCSLFLKRSASAETKGSQVCARPMHI